MKKPAIDSSELINSQRHNSTMPSPLKNREFNPFCLNFRKLQQYRLDAIPIEQVILFEYFMMLAQSFGYREFYHTQSKIIEETGLKRAKIEKVVSIFEGAGILSVETKGFPLKQHFKVNIPKVIELLPNIYQFAENDKLHAEINKLYAEISKQFAENNTLIETNKRNSNKETKKATKDMMGSFASRFNYSLLEVKNFLDLLERKFNTRRNEKQPGKYPPAELPFKKNVAAAAQDALNEMGQKLIEDAWLVYIDKIINNELRPKQILKYFFDKKEGEFDVIGTMGDLHNTNYIFTDWKNK
jgi:hypothetical protein